VDVTTEEVLADLKARLEKAYQELTAMADKTGRYQEHLRLEAKASGVALALDYLRGY
jgi:hypothetical protein